MTEEQLKKHWLKSQLETCKNEINDLESWKETMKATVISANRSVYVEFFNKKIKKKKALIEEIKSKISIKEEV
jgi:DNA-binding protein H-NS